MRNRIQDLLCRLSSFSADERGATAIIFTLMLTAIVMAGGIAIDISRATHMRQQIAAAADAAALAAGRAALDGRLSVAQAEEAGKRIFEANMPKTGEGTFGDIGKISVKVDRNTGKAVVNVEAEVKMTLARVMKIESQPVNVEVETMFGAGDIELAMALDVTGSMGGQKLTDLKNAAKDLVNILIANTSTQAKTRIGLVPYSGAVNAGPYASKATNGSTPSYRYTASSSYDVESCVVERSGSHRYKDTAPKANAWIGTHEYQYCPVPEILPLTDNKTKLDAEIDSYIAFGGTAGHIGTAWAWYMVSPKWQTFWPTASRPADVSADTIKAVLLMTDGEFNTWYDNANGNSSKQAKKLCAQMKKKGVVVYSVAFKAPKSAEKMLKKCASSERHYFNATNSAALRGAFQEVARSLTRLRLSK